MAARAGSPKTRSVGRYELVIELAKSHLGALWIATAESDGAYEAHLLRRVQLPPSIPAADGERVRQAAEFSRTLKDDHILPLVDTSQGEGELALVSGYVPGETLRALLRLCSFKREPVPPRVALEIVLDVCEALLAAEIRAVSAPLGPDFFYGGLLPDSIIVGTDGTSRLVDLGIAAVWRRLPALAEHPEVTAYSAPEQFGGRAIDSRADVFVLGILLWEMLSGGRRLFVGSSHRGVVEKVLQFPIPDVDPKRPGEAIDPAVQQLVRKMLERDPRRRFRSIADLKQAIEQLGSALPIEVSDFVTTFARSPLSSRERVLERALQRPAHVVRPGPREPATATPPGASSPAGTNAPRAPMASTPAVRPPSASPGLSSPPVHDSDNSSEAAGATEARVERTPPRAVAKPLPLPAQATLGRRLSAPDGVLPPPPKRPRKRASEDDASSVRAADIMRALAVEDAEPESDGLPTLPAPPAGQAAQPQPPPLPDRPHEDRFRPHQQTLPGPGDVEETALPRPPIATLPGYAGPEPPKPAAPEPAAPGGQPPSDTRGEAGASRPVASATAESGASPLAAPDAELRAVAAPTTTGVSPRPASRPSISGSRRLPVPLIAGLGGGALLLLIGLAVGTADGPEPTADADATNRQSAARQKAAQPEPELTKVAESHKPAPQTPPAEESEPAEPEANETDDTAEGEDATDDVAPTEGSEASPPPSDGSEPKTTHTAPAPRARAPRPPPASPKKQIRAKRTFIPSGI